VNPTRILVFAGSIRSGALSARVAAAAAKELALIADTEVTTLSLADYPLPIYDGDLEVEKGVPENATRLAKLIAAHQGVFISTPEYNHSLPPLLTNTLAWISRIRHSGTLAYRHKVYAIAGSSDGRIAGARAVIDLRKVLVPALGGIVIPARVEVAQAQHAFNESGELVDPAAAKMLQATVRQLIEMARRMAD
jgi:NAD(P)H-dependent FMN reductase